MKKVKNIFCVVLAFLGLVFLLAFAMAFTNIPYYAYHNLGTQSEVNFDTPDYIVLFGGSGMPSPDGLMRSYYTAMAANRYSMAKIIIASPDESLKIKTDSALSYSGELAIRGVELKRVVIEDIGINTYTQAKNIYKIVQKDTTWQPNILVVTTPEHVYRSVMCLKKTGLNNVAGLGAFEKPIDENLLTEVEKLSKNKKDNLNIRYNLWSYLGYEIIVMREYVAITYYKLKGWI